MKIQINTDHNIEGSAELSAQISAQLVIALNRISAQITRLEVHLSDKDAGKGGHNDKLCLMEARLEGRQPIAVTHQADTLDLAVDGAAAKLTRFIDSALGKRRHRESLRTVPLPPYPEFTG